MSRESDVVEDIFIRIRDILGEEFKGEIAIRIDAEETKIRQDWGGIESYIAKKKDRMRRREIAITELRRGTTVKEVVNLTGMCRSHLYKLLKTK